MANNFRRTLAGRFGTAPAFTHSEKIGTITSAGTDTFRIPTPYRKAYVLGAAAQAQTAPIVTTGTSTATLKKFVAADGSSVTLTSGLDLETLVANKGKGFSFLSTLSDADLTLIHDDVNNICDTLYVDVVNGTTIATQPVALYFTVELGTLE